jgi:hypothetical protein
MGIANIDRRASAARASTVVPGGVWAGDGVTRVRPYTAFERGGIYRFGSGHPGPKVFRVA